MNSIDQIHIINPSQFAVVLNQNTTVQHSSFLLIPEAVGHPEDDDPEVADHLEAVSNPEAGQVV